MAKTIDISLLGDRALARKLHELPLTVGKKVLRPTLRASAKRLKAFLILNLSGGVVSPHTGRWLAAVQATPVRALKRSRTRFGAGLEMPSRAELGIDPKDKWYSPFAVEYGYTRTARAPVDVRAFEPIRKAVDDHAASELRTIANDIGNGIKRVAKPVFK